ncbi:bacteriocin immunity protein [Streptomyces sp. NPDC048045]|uniref:bacteriocin immunity protein n=1 Tax=Streptomyces sp. NPDC048045 TaxID=3154710 RepID=UPI003445EAA0
MELRRELLPAPVPAERPAELGEEIERIENLLHEDAEAGQRAIDAFNAATGNAYGPSAFVNCAAAGGPEAFALEAARPARPRVPDVTRAELGEIVRRIMAAPGDPDTDHYLLVLETNVAHPRSRDLIFHPPAHLVDASPERIVDEMLAYRPIAL